MKKANKLISQQSPYLLQHAYNPVDWFPWGEEAFEKAKEENKPIFLSIGYSTCHWCHVMEKESFVDLDVASILNKYFVAIKVDREERPDIDGIYMAGCQLLTGSGGWPLTAFLNHDKKPFFIGTYFPKNSNYGRPGLLSILQNINSYWKSKKNELLKTSEDVFNSLNKSFSISETNLDSSIVEEAFKSLRKNYDNIQGGFGLAPKFPSPHNVVFLLRYFAFTKDDSALNMAYHTLNSMRLGGIYDQVGFGFHRYSTDREWLVPHFEKMLYDQALISAAYIEAYQVSNNEFYKDTTVQIFEYVFEVMTSQQGAFYSAEDADSENMEGKYYLWKKSELEQILSSEELILFCHIYNIEDAGNFSNEINSNQKGETNYFNIPHLTKSFAELSAEYNFTLYNLNRKINEINSKLYSQRSKRIHPHKDDKILTDWNALMISSLSKAYIAFNIPKYIDAAETCMSFLLENLMCIDSAAASENLPATMLLHVHRNGKSAISGFIDDYAFVIKALLDLFDATHKPLYVKKALELQEYFSANFWDNQIGGYFKTSNSMNEFSIKQKEVFDGAIPSGNSTAFLNLLRLFHITTEPKYFEQANKLSGAFANYINAYPVGYTYFILGMLFLKYNSFDIIVALSKSGSAEKLLVHELKKRYIPFKEVIVITPENREELISILPFLSNYLPVGEKPGIYICKDFTCSFPVTSIEEFDLLIKSFT